MPHERRANRPGELLHQREVLRCLDRRQRVRRRPASHGRSVDRLDILDVLVLIHSNREVLILHDTPAKELECASLLFPDVDEPSELVSGLLVDRTASGPQAVVNVHIEHAAKLALLVVDLEGGR